MMNNRLVLITGATSGVGLATANLLAQHQFRVICCGRRKERLREIKNALGKQCHTLRFDVSDSRDVFKAIDSLPGEFSKIDVLINNAGNAHGLDSVESSSLDDWNAMIDSNIKGLMYVTKAIIGPMINRKSGHIINIGSIAGKEVYPKGSVYCATKFAVDAFTKGLRLDLNSHRIKVSAVHPGLVETEFSLVRFKGNRHKAKNVYYGMQPLIAQDIAQCILFMVTQPSHVNVADMVVLPTDQASSIIVNRQ